MEEQIKKIISDNYDPDWEELGLEKTAREITSHVMEFIHWLIDEQEIFMGELSEKYIINDNPHLKENTLKEIYQYWLTNIKTK